MKFAALIAAACAGVLLASAMPVNPVRVVFDYEQHRMQKPPTPEQMGFHGSAVVLSPIAPPPPLKLDLGQSLDPQARYELQRNDQRMQDMRAYARDPSHWVGPPPN